MLADRRGDAIDGAMGQQTDKADERGEQRRIELASDARVLGYIENDRRTWGENVHRSHDHASRSDAQLGVAVLHADVITAMERPNDEYRN